MASRTRRGSEQRSISTRTRSTTSCARRSSCCSRYPRLGVWAPRSPRGLRTRVHPPRQHPLAYDHRPCSCCFFAPSSTPPLRAPNPPSAASTIPHLPSLLFLVACPPARTAVACSHRHFAPATTSDVPATPHTIRLPRHIHHFTCISSNVADSVQRSPTAAPRPRFLLPQNSALRRANLDVIRPRLRLCHSHARAHASNRSELRQSQRNCVQTAVVAHLAAYILEKGKAGRANDRQLTCDVPTRNFSTKGNHAACR